MKWYSTNHKSPLTSLHDAVLQGLAPDGGLYLPTEIPSFSLNFIEHLHSMSIQEIAFEVARQFTKQEITKATLEEIIDCAITFDAPLAKIEDEVYSLELFHGPTLAFKDFGARFMARLTAQFVQNLDRELTVLVATSGDTGSAVAHGFMDIDGIRVVLLYPSGRVSKIQEQQLTTLGGNVTAVELDGTFDDCQKLVKQAATNSEVLKKLNLTSANSINIARLIPQIFYYFRGVGQLQQEFRDLVISVPSGNFGNLTAGILAKKMGLPIQKFIAATNINDIVPKYLESGIYEPKPSIETIANAMDVGNPSNFSRILELYDHSVDKIRKDICGAHFTDDQIRDTIHEVFEATGTILDPHGAIGYMGLINFIKNSSIPRTGIFLATAHPAKFWDHVYPIVGDQLQMPDSLQQALDKEKQSILMENDFEQFKELLLNLIYS